MEVPPGAGQAGASCVGIDIGGTYTDLVILGAGTWRVAKCLSSPEDPSRAVLDSIRALDLGPDVPIVHGSTVATNTLIERTGGRTAFVATAGFGDLLALGRGDRGDLYALEPQPRPNLVPPTLCFEVAERLDARGAVLVPLRPRSLRRLVRQVVAAEVEAVAICFLFAYLDDSHEVAVAAALRSAVGGPPQVFSSAKVLAEFREYERASTTVVNAYVAPRTARYLARMAVGVAPRPLSIMASHGGLMTPTTACQLPAAMLLSGPAGGVLGALAVGRRAGASRLVTCDMGGTSTDVALLEGELPFTGIANVGGIPVHLPAVDMRTIGAGGGSLLWVDDAGGLRVGPRSAGSDPGPACYGRGGRQPTLTDAQVVAGRLPAGPLGGGALDLKPDLARASMGPLACALNMSAEDLAMAALAVADAAMARAVRAVSVERGYDPADFTLVAFGGAGPLHACGLAEAVGMRRILVPATPGALSALGLATAEPVATASQSLLRRDPRLLDVAEVYCRLEAQVCERLGQTPVRLDRLVDARYRGQSWELTVPWPADGHVTPVFEAAHAHHFGYSRPGTAVEVVTLRVRARGRPLAGLPPPPALVDSREGSAQIYVGGGVHEWVPMLHRFSLVPGQRLEGPLILSQPDTTVFVASGWRGWVGAWGDLFLKYERIPASPGG